MKLSVAASFVCTLLLTSMGICAESGYLPEANAYPTRPASALDWFDSYSEAVSLAQASSKPILILFTGSSWCPACISLEKNVLSRPEFGEAVGSRFVFLKAEFSRPGAFLDSPYKTLMDRYGIEAFPTMVVVNSRGELLYRVNYRAGGVQAYTQELLQKLSDSSFRSS